jgi:amidase
VKEGFSHPAVDPRVSDEVRRGIERLAAAGAEVMEISVPAHFEAARLLSPLLAEGFASLVELGGVVRHVAGRQDPELARILSQTFPERAQHLSLMAKLLLLQGRHLRESTGGSAYAAAQNARPALRAAYDQALDQVDLLAMPTTPTTATRWEPERDELERLLANMALAANTAPFDLSGHPSLSVPCGAIDGLPVGLMLTGRHFEDATVMRGGRAVEQAGT